MFSCYLFNLSQPLLPPLWPQVCSPFLPYQKNKKTKHHPRLNLLPSQLPLNFFSSFERKTQSVASFPPPHNYRTHQNQTHPVTIMLWNPWWILSPHLSWPFSGIGYRGSLPPLKYNLICLWRYQILLSFLLTLSGHSFSVFITSLSFESYL